MPNHSADLAPVFRALADPTRRAVVERLSRGPCAVSELAAPFEMALPSFVQHLKQLEEAGLVSTEKAGRTRTVSLNADRLGEGERWFSELRGIWNRRLDQLESHLEQRKL